VYKESTRFRAVISHKGKSIHIGMFDTAEEAADAYNKKSKEFYGDEGKINTIPRAALSAAKKAAKAKAKAKADAKKAAAAAKKSAKAKSAPKAKAKAKPKAKAKKTTKKSTKKK